MKPNVFVHTVNSRRAEHGALSQLSPEKVELILSEAEKHYDFELALHKQIAKHAIIVNPLVSKRESDTFPRPFAHTEGSRGHTHCPHCEHEQEEIRQCLSAVRKAEYAIIALPSLGGTLMQAIFQECSIARIPTLLLTSNPSVQTAPRLIETMDFRCFNAVYTDIDDMRKIIDVMFEDKLFKNGARALIQKGYR